MRDMTAAAERINAARHVAAAVTAAARVLALVAAVVPAGATHGVEARLPRRALACAERCAGIEHGSHHHLS